VKETDVLLLGEGILHSGLERLLLDRGGGLRVRRASSWRDAKVSLLERKPDVLIVESADAAAVLAAEAELEDLKVICLTREQNQMLVVRFHHSMDVTLEDLLRALGGETEASEAPESPEVPDAPPQSSDGP